MAKKIFIIIGIIVVIIISLIFIGNILLKKAGGCEEEIREEGDACGPNYEGLCKDGLYCNQVDYDSDGEPVGICSADLNKRDEWDSCGPKYIGKCDEGLLCIGSDKTYPDGACMKEDYLESCSKCKVFEELECY